MWGSSRSTCFERENIEIDALMFAARYSQSNEIIKLLLNRNADVNAKTHWGETALMFAVDKGHIENVKLLLNLNANVNVKTLQGKTALMKAAGRYPVETDNEIIKGRGL